MASETGRAKIISFAREFHESNSSSDILPGAALNVTQIDRTAKRELIKIFERYSQHLIHDMLTLIATFFLNVGKLELIVDIIELLLSHGNLEFSFILLEYGLLQSFKTSRLLTLLLLSQSLDSS